MKKIIVRSLLLFSFGILAVFSIAVIIVMDNMNKTAAKDHAANLLSVFENQMILGRYASVEDYKTLAAAAGETKDIRVTVIATNGDVLADTGFENVTDKNHSGRKEVIEALRGEIGTDIRMSETVRIRLLYKAKLVEIPGGAERVVLRVAVPIQSINSYLYGTLLIMAAIFLLILAASVLVSRYAAEKINRPFVLIKEKLGDVLNPTAEAKPIILTKHDDINVVLQDIDEISEKLNSTLAGYQSEKRKLELILNNIDYGIIALDRERRVVSCNKPAEDYFCFECIAPAPIETLIRNKNILDNIYQAVGKNEFISYDHTRLNGQTFEVRFFPVNLQEVSLIITAQNVTDIRKTSLEKQEFFANAGHELNTPLSSVIGYSEMLRADKKYNGAFTETILKEALRMKLLIEDMLKISELEENKELRDEAFDLNAVVGQAVTAALPKAESKQITLTANLASCAVVANPEKITEVAANLIDNAIKYTNAGGTVEVGLKAENGKAVLSVKDNGIGIPAKALSRVFERFYRVDKGRSKAEGGTGLGLAIVKHICNHYNAPIKIQSKEGAGTEITVTFTRA